MASDDTRPLSPPPRLTNVEKFAWSVIEYRDGASRGEIGERLDVCETTLDDALKTLRDRDLAETRTDPEDNRRRIYVLTDAPTGE